MTKICLVISVFNNKTSGKVGVESSTFLLVIVAMFEAGLDKQQIAELLIKYWDFRPSEAKKLIETNSARIDDQ